MSKMEHAVSTRVSPIQTSFIFQSQKKFIPVIFLFTQSYKEIVCYAEKDSVKKMFIFIKNENNMKNEYYEKCLLWEDLRGRKKKFTVP